MKHNSKITFIILGMFLLTQFFGIYVVDYYSSSKVSNGELIEVNATELPFYLDVAEPQADTDFGVAFLSIVFAFMIAIFLLLLLTRLNAEVILKTWFFLVVAIAIGISLNVFFTQTGISWPWILAISLGLILAFFKIFKRGFLNHNLTELLIYPGIAAVFVPILNFYTLIILLIIISVYDMWAVWHSGIMQKMAKYHINKLNIFPGFFVPYSSKKIKLQIQKIRNSKKSKSEKLKKLGKFKINVAVLGGGDIVFPIIAAGVVLKTIQELPFALSPFIGGLWPAVFVVLGAALGLGYLLFFSEKKKFYPAMPFITLGIFLGMIISYLVFS